MSGYNITGWSGGGRQPLTYNLKAGQFRGMGRVNVIPSQTTIINNNIIGGGTFATQCYDTGTPKWLTALMAIGLGSSLVGGILGMFGIGGGGGGGGTGTVEGAGGKEEPQTKTKAEDPTQSKEYKALQAQHEKDLAEIARLKEQAKAFQETQQPATTPKTEEPQAQQEEKPDYSFIKNGARMVCTDASGKTQDISGTLSNVQTDADGVPQSFTLTDGTSGNKYQYEVRVGKDGTLTYECVSKNGQATIGAPTYTLKDGKLVNEQNQNGYSQGIKTQSAPQQPTTPQTEQVGNKQPQASVQNKNEQVNIVKSYSIKTRSGNSLKVQIDDQGGKHYIDKNGQEIDEQEFKKQTGLTGDQVVQKANANKLPQDALNWNKSHPNMQITMKNGKLTTTVQTISNTNGRVSKEISADNFENLKKAVEEFIRSQQQSPSLGYASLGGAMQIKQ